MGCIVVVGLCLLYCVLIPWFKTCVLLCCVLSVLCCVLVVCCLLCGLVCIVDCVVLCVLFIVLFVLWLCVLCVFVLLQKTNSVKQASSVVCIVCFCV